MRTPLLVTILTALGAVACETWESGQVCITVADGSDACPPADEIDEDAVFSLAYCSVAARDIRGAGELVDDEGLERTLCCYAATVKDEEPGCVVGRPFSRDGVALRAEVRPGSGWATVPTSVTAPSPALAAAWLDAALGEHASIAAFARLTLELMAVGAPAHLLADVQAAAADEVQHARLCFSMAARFGFDAVEPGRLDLGPAVELATDPVQIAVAAVREGCIGETVSAWLAEHAAARATDRESRRVLTRIAEDEAKHAALSWSLVAWMLAERGDRVREPIIAALQDPVAVGPMLVGGADLAAFGAITPVEHAALLDRVRGEILEPAARALLAA